MPFDMDRYLECRRNYLENRSKYPLEELAKYIGKWIAWSPDTRIVASTSNPDELEGLVQAAGEDPVYCVVEGVPEFDSFLGYLHVRAS